MDKLSADDSLHSAELAMSQAITLQQRQAQEHEALIRELQQANAELQKQVALLTAGQNDVKPDAIDAKMQGDDYLRSIAGRIARLGGWSIDLAAQRVKWSPQVYEIHELPCDGKQISVEDGINFFAPDYRDRLREVFTACATEGIPYDEELQIITAKGNRIWVRSIAEAVRDEMGAIVGIQGAFQDISDRKQAERALLLSRQEFHRFANSMPQIVWTAEPDGTIDYANAAFYSYIGEQHNPHQVLSNWSSYLHPDDITNCQQVWQFTVTTRQPFRVEYRIRNASGLYRWHLATAMPVYSTGGQVIKWYGTTIDIHDRRMAESAAQSYAQRLYVTLESISDGLFTIDRQWRFTFFNTRAERLLQRSRDQMLGRNIWTELPEAVDTVLYPSLHEAMVTGRATVLELFYPPLSTWFDVSVYPSEAGLAVYFQDVNERHAQEAQLRESEARFRAVARATADVIWDWNLKNDVVWWSEGFQTVFGYAAEEIELDGQSWKRRVHPDDFDRLMKGVQDAIAQRHEFWHDDYRFLHQDGHWMDISDRGYLIFDDEGQPVRFVGGMTDMTERFALAEQLRQSQRLESVGQLTGGVAHDFNNLLTVILGNSELLIEQLDDRPKLQALANMTKSAAQRGADLTHRLLAFARRQTLAPQAVQVNELLNELEPLLRRTIASNIAIEFVLSQDLWNCFIDPSQLEAAILNLSLNARDALSSSGKLTIETSNAYLDRNYVNQQADVIPGEYVLIAITDTGEGIPPDLIDRVFDPFFTTKAAGKGTGLGLSMVYGFVKQSEGHIKIYSELGHGTTVKLYLPRTQQVEGISRIPRGTIAEIPSGSETVLIVEDDNLVRAYVEEQLRNLGYRVISAQTGDAALHIIHENSTIDLLLTDIMMPGSMDGKQLADRVRELRPEMAVLFTSGYAEHAIIHQGRLEPGVFLLSKPYCVQDLAQMVRQALVSRRVL